MQPGAAWILEGRHHQPPGPAAALHLFLSAFDGVPDLRTDNARHDLGEMLVVVSRKWWKLDVGVLSG